MNPKYTKIISIICLFLISLSVFSQDLSTAPFWYTEIPIYPDCLFGIGWGESVESATNKARTDLAAQKQSRIFQEFILTEFEKNNQGVILTSSELEVTTQQVVDTLLDSAIRVDMKANSENDYYVLICTSLNPEIPLSELLVHIRDELEQAQSRRRRNSTISSVVLPGSAHMSSHQVPKGITLMAIAAMTLAGGTYSLIQANYDLQTSENQTNRELREYYSQRATSWAIISLGCYSLFAADSIYSATDNYRRYE